MAAISSKEREIKALITRLNEAIYQFAHFAEGMVEERKEITEQATALKALTEKVAEQQEHLLSIEKQIKKSINELFLELSERISESTSEVVSASVSEKVNAKINEATDELRCTVKESAYIFKKYADQGKLKKCLFHVGVFVGIVILGCLMNKLILPHSMFDLTSQQFKIYSDGLLLESFWPRLQTKDQNTLLQIANSALSSRSAAH